MDKTDLRYLSGLVDLLSNANPAWSMNYLIEDKVGIHLEPMIANKIRVYLADRLNSVKRSVEYSDASSSKIFSLYAYISILDRFLSEEGWNIPIGQVSSTIKNGKQILGLDKNGEVSPFEVLNDILEYCERPYHSANDKVIIHNNFQAVSVARLESIASYEASRSKDISNYADKYQKPTTTRLRYIQLIRSVAILLVIAAHASDPITTFNLKDPIYTGLFRSSNALFIFISGFLFQYLSIRFEYSKYLKSKIRNVVIPYIIMSIPALCAIEFGYGSRMVSTVVGSDISISSFIFILLTGIQIAPFWFIPMMCIFFIFSPIFHVLNRDVRYYSILFPLIIISMLVGRGGVNPFLHALFYAPAYIFGMLVSDKRATILPFIKASWPMLLLLSAIPWSLPEDGFYLDNAFMISKLLWCLCLIAFLNDIDSMIPSWFDSIGELSFGIFFVHYYFISAAKFINHRLLYDGIGAYLAIFAFTAALSIATVSIIKKLAGQRSRWLVGA